MDSWILIFGSTIVVIVVNFAVYYIWKYIRPDVLLPDLQDKFDIPLRVITAITEGELVTLFFGRDVSNTIVSGKISQYLDCVLKTR